MDVPSVVYSWSWYSYSVQLLQGACPNQTLHGFPLCILMMVVMICYILFLCQQTVSYQTLGRKGEVAELVCDPTV